MFNSFDTFEKWGSLSVAFKIAAPFVFPKMWPQCSWDMYIFPDNWTASLVEQHCQCNKNVFRSHLYSFMLCPPHCLSFLYLSYTIVVISRQIILNVWLVVNTFEGKVPVFEGGFCMGHWCISSSWWLSTATVLKQGTISTLCTTSEALFQVQI